MNIRTPHLIAVFTFCFLLLNCKKRSNGNKVTIENVVIIVVDGPRFIDLESDTLRSINQPFQTLKSQSLFFSNFFNDGITNTQNGMSCILTGNTDSLTNNGSELSIYPNIFHHYLESKSVSNSKTWIITSKDKLESLKNTTHLVYSTKPTALSNSGINGLNSGYRHDSITHRIALDVLITYQPNVAFISYREPDHSGHQSNWGNYKKGIFDSYNYAQEIVNFIKSSRNYMNNTLILITNDHGRHLDHIADGFTSHGDNCEGCRHISLFAISPNIQPGTIDNTIYSQHNIAPTIAKILQFSMPTALSNPISSIE